MKSPIIPFVFRNNFYYLKRDDLINSEFNGNKARKLYYFLKNDFPNVKYLISYGSNQSNAMYSMSLLAKLKGWEFVYYTNHISSYLKENPTGNYKRALENGMNIIEVDLRGDQLREFVLSKKNKYTLVIEEGARNYEASFGIKLLADELKYFVENYNLKVFLPSATGTTAYYLQQYLNTEVLTTNCVGSEEYLIKQFKLLGNGKLPTILPPKRKYKFGKLYKHFYELFLELKSNSVEFDLLYDMIGWEVVLEYGLKDIIYIHQGGLIGNESMIERYKRKFNFC